MSGNKQFFSYIPQAELRVLLIEITQKCNAACDHCGSRCDIHSEEILSAEEIVDVFRDIKDSFGTGTMINITGGEPLMRKDLFDIMEQAHSMGFDWGMVTNGTLINDSVIEDMKRTGMKTITVSIDGVGETHESLRHLPGSYERILQHLKKLKDADFLDCLQVTFTSNRRNYKELPKLYEDLSEIGIDGIRTSCIDPIGRAGEHPELMMGRQELQYVLDFMKEQNSKTGSLPIEWGCCHYLGDRVQNRKFLCFAGIYAASILYNGDIFVCPNVERRPELIQGNIRKNRFSKVWKEGYRQFRERKIPHTCRNCRYVTECRGDSQHTYDFDLHRPKFCYREIFDTETKAYEAYLKQKFPKLKRTEVLGQIGTDTVYIEPEAYREIQAYFHTGHMSPLSAYEQQMGLIGFRIDHNYVVKYVFPSAISSVAGDLAFFTKDTIPQAIRTTRSIIQNFPLSDDRNDMIGRGLTFLGFLHSHPTQEELCYSVGDEILHKRLYSRFGDYMGMLIYPKKELIGVYLGKTIRQGNLCILEDS